MTSTKVRSPAEADVAKVVPTPNNGFSEVVRVRRTTGGGAWIMFQKLKFVWDADKKLFKGVEYPVDHSYQHYLDWKGYDDEQVKEMTSTHGNNT